MVINIKCSVPQNSLLSSPPNIVKKLHVNLNRLATYKVDKLIPTSFLAALTPRHRWFVAQSILVTFAARTAVSTKIVVPQYKATETLETSRVDSAMGRWQRRTSSNTDVSWSYYKKKE